MATLDNQKLKQIFLLSLILAIAFLVIQNLITYLSGFLGALTLYILFKDIYRKLVEEKKWNGTLCAIVIMLAATVLLLVPFTFMGYILIDKITYFISHPEPIIAQWNVLNQKIIEWTGKEILSPEIIQHIQVPISKFLPNMLGSTLLVVMNFALMYFSLFFMFVNSRKMESFVKELFPMHETNTKIVGNKAKEMIISNAIVIPLLALIQGIFALIGYLIFGVNTPFLMALLTAITSVIPMIGTMIIWIPLSLLFFAHDQISSGIGLLLYGGIIITNIDNVVRFILQKKIANVHPLITILGVIIGVKIFGFVGLIFGPTLLSLLLLLVHLYAKEFTNIKI
ncbi:MAG: AI-2E family transporter [Chitinophagales bacterium]|nr:AI-2E family transporter [Chitinophagales bacterium]